MVLVILAILMAVLIPALLGWIDKAKEQQITTNANAALVAAQGLVGEYYGTANAPSSSEAITYVTASSCDKIKTLTDIQEGFDVSITMKDSTNHKGFIIDTFVYTPTGGTKKATWHGTKADDNSYAAGTWVVANVA